VSDQEWQVLKGWLAAQRGFDVGKQVKGRKQHIVVESVGHLLFR